MNPLAKDFAFWTELYAGDDCFLWACNKAYADMSRTLTFRDVPKNDSHAEAKRVEALRKNLRDCGTAVIRERLTQLCGDFRQWHEETCTLLKDIYGDTTLVVRDGTARTEIPARMTHGQAQKWLNMSLKYLWLADRLDMITVKDVSDILRSRQQDFHVPLDSYILRYIAKKDKSRACPFPADNGLNGSFEEFRDILDSSWSHLEDTESYYKLQKHLATAVGDRPPLEWELEHWHKALRYYG